MSTLHVDCTDYLFKVASDSESNGTVSYGTALKAAEENGVEYKFLQDYGIAGDWEDPENGDPIGVDAGELLVWLGY